MATMTQFSDLPSCLVIDILLKLPLKTLVTCMYVRKDWFRLVFRDPYFIKLHLAASPVHLLDSRGVLWKEGRLFQFGQVMEDERTGDLELNIVRLRNLYNSRYNTCDSYRTINSCNGLLCLVIPHYKHYNTGPYPGFSCVCLSVLVCNPILGEWVSISTLDRRYHHSSIKIVLVFSAKNNQYKLLHGFRAYQEEHYRFEILTLGGTRGWRSIDATLGGRPWKGKFYDRHCSIHGSVHWTNLDTTTHELFICCFDVDDEKFQRLSLPIPEGQSSLSSRLQLGAINGCLCALFFYGRHSDDVEIWAMKEYGVETSWSRMHTFHASGLSYPSLLFSPNEEEILMCDRDERLVSYNLKRNLSKHRQPDKANAFYYGLAYKPSFVSLQDVAKGHIVNNIKKQCMESDGEALIGV